LVLPGRAFGAVGRVGINFNGKFAGRAILTKPGTFFTERASLAWNAITNRIVVIFVVGVVRNELVGRAYFALQIV